MLDEARTLVDTFTTAINTGQLELLRSCIADDYIQHNPRVAPGLAGVQQSLARWRAAVDGLRVVIEDVVAGQDRVVARMTVSGRQVDELLGVPATGRTFSIEVIDIWRVEDGKFAEHWDQMDLLSLLRQIQQT